MSEDIYRDEFRQRVLSGRPRSILEVGAGGGAFLKTVVGEAGRLAGLAMAGSMFSVATRMNWSRSILDCSCHKPKACPSS